jgi:hypothetical protein
MIFKYLQKENTPILERSRIGKGSAIKPLDFGPSRPKCGTCENQHLWGAIRVHRKRSATLMTGKLAKGIYPLHSHISIERAASVAGQRDREHDSLQLESSRV